MLAERERADVDELRQKLSYQMRLIDSERLVTDQVLQDKDSHIADLQAQFQGVKDRLADIDAVHQQWRKAGNNQQRKFEQRLELVKLEHQNETLRLKDFISKLQQQKLNDQSKSRVAELTEQCHQLTEQLHQGEEYTQQLKATLADIERVHSKRLDQQKRQAQEQLQIALQITKQQADEGSATAHELVKRADLRVQRTTQIQERQSKQSAEDLRQMDLECQSRLQQMESKCQNQLKHLEDFLLQEKRKALSELRQQCDAERLQYVSECQQQMATEIREADKRLGELEHKLADKDVQMNLQRQYMQMQHDKLQATLTAKIELLEQQLAKAHEELAQDSDFRQNVNSRHTDTLRVKDAQIKELEQRLKKLANDDHDDTALRQVVAEKQSLVYELRRADQQHLTLTQELTRLRNDFDALRQESHERADLIANLKLDLGQASTGNTVEVDLGIVEELEAMNARVEHAIQGHLQRIESLTAKVQ